MQPGTVLALGVATALLVAGPAVGLAALGDGPGSTEAEGVTAENETGASVSPGERLSGVVGAGQAELDGDLDQRTLGVQIAQAATETARAEVVAVQLESVEQRLADLEQRKATLDQQRATGQMSEGRYQSEITRVAAQSRALEALNNRTGQVAAGLPADLLAERGVDAERIETLRSQARNLSGGEVAEIARNIAGGPEMPGGPAGGPPDSPGLGPPDDDNRTGGVGPPGDDNPGGGPGGPPDDSPDEPPDDERPGGPEDD